MNRKTMKCSRKPPRKTRKPARKARKSVRKARKPTAKRRKRAASGRSSSAERTRLDRVVDAQQSAVTRFSDFAEQVADMTMRGTYTPSKWVSVYGSMWKNLAGDMANLTRELFKD